VGPDYSKGSVPLHLFNFDSRNVCRKGHVFREGFYMDLFFTLGTDHICTAAVVWTGGRGDRKMY